MDFFNFGQKHDDDQDKIQYAEKNLKIFRISLNMLLVTTNNNFCL